MLRRLLHPLVACLALAAGTLGWSGDFVPSFARVGLRTSAGAF
jgi:hypothetical protein